MRLLSFTTLYPNAAQPGHGVFVENRLRHLAAEPGVDLRVVAPVPWFPSSRVVFGRYGEFARAPLEEERSGITIRHPRYPVVPKVGMTLAPWLLYRAAIPELRRLVRGGYDFDLIDAHYAYPDGVAAAMLGRRFRRPVVVTVRGSDVTLIPRYRLPRAMILRMIRRTAAVVTVSADLRRRLLDLGADPERVHVLRNGVDLRMFRPSDRDRERRARRMERPTVISVGNLVPLKGHDLVIRALRDLPDVGLVIAGEGPEKQRLATLARDSGLGDRVRLIGSVPHERLRGLYVAADLLALASSREGWPNVLLEALACGTPVVSTNVGGCAEIVRDPAAGRLIDERTPRAIAGAIRALLADPPDRAETRRYAERFDWAETTRGQISLFAGIVGP